MKNYLRTTLAGLICLLGSQTVIAAETRVGAEFVGEVVHPITVTVNLKKTKKLTQWQPGDPIKEIPMRSRRPKDWERPEALPRGFGVDSLALKQWDIVGDQRFGNETQFSNTIVNVDGTDFTGSNPADANGDVGIDHYIQAVNGGPVGSIIHIINKADGSLAASFALEEIAAGSGSACASSIADPVILFDQFVDNGPGNPKGRWVLTDITGNSLCMYISQTHDPIGPNDDSTWYMYEFNSASGGLPDYPKFGVWSDAYYLGANENNRQYAFDRANMINGNPARGFQVFQTVGLPGFGFQHLMPADADGQTMPPAGAPGIFMRHRDAQFHGDTGSDLLEIWEFTTDFDTPANSAVTGPFNINVSDFDTNLGGVNFGATSVPQPGAGELDPLKQPLMWRVQHRTVNDKQFLVGNMTTDVNGNDYHGVRWWILERPSDTLTDGWILSDEGTFTSGDGITTGDGVHRWMASAAMDSSGNFAIGYNTSAVVGNNASVTDVFAGMRYAGRLSFDPAGTLPRGENSIIEGTAANGASRYGDYTSLSVDPVDECTFWYTAQYNNAPNWSTRIASFRFQECGCELPVDPVTLTSVSANSDNNINVTWNDAPDAQISEYRIFRSTTSGAGYVLIDTITDTTPGIPNDGSYSYDDTNVSAGTEYFYVIRSSDGAACGSSFSVELSAVATGICTLEPQFFGVNDASNNATAVCGITVQWQAGSSMCPAGDGDLTYSVYRSTDPSFVPSVANAIATGLSALNYDDQDASLVSDTDYFYVVRATDTDNNIEDDNIRLTSSFPTGPVTLAIFDENLDTYITFVDAQAAGWSTIANSGTTDWRIEVGDDSTTGTGSAFVSTNVPEVADKSLITRSFVPSETSVLSFNHKYMFETNGAGDRFFDGGVLEISIDGGTNWQDLDTNITTGGYNATLDGGFGQPLGATPAWSGVLTDFSLVTVDLAPFAGQLANIRWRMGTDSSVGSGDWKVDDIVITDTGSFGQCNLEDLIFADGFEN